MKKLLAVLLAVLMLGGALAVRAGAEDGVPVLRTL